MLNRSLSLVLVALLSAVAGSGCKDELRPGHCFSNKDCVAGQMCDSIGVCVMADDGGAGGGQGGAGQGGAGQGGAQAGRGGAGGGGVGGAAGMGGATVPGPDALPPDAFVCKRREDCSGATPVCDTSTGKCVQCLTAAECPTAAAAVCSATKTCAGCSMDGHCAGRSDGVKACDSATGACVACTKNQDCSGATPVCKTTSHTCVGCLADGDCSGATPICNTAMNTCAACGSRAQCSGKSQALPACHTDGSCVECSAADSAKCSGSTPVCNVAQRKCVACLSDGDCKSAEAPICNTTTNTCMPCSMDSQCEARNSSTKGCASGRCVQCSKSEHCGTGTQPICTSNACAGCTSDSQCAAKSNLGPNPGVCMSHQDGRCATDAESIYVQNQSGCLSSGAGGTSSMPFCHPQPAADAAQSMPPKRLIVLRGPRAFDRVAFSISTGQLSVVGQSGAVIGGGSGTGIHLTAGDLYVRSVAVKSSLDVGVLVDSAGTIHLVRCNVEGNAGGIFINQGGYEIINTIVANNDTGSAGAFVFGGIAIAPPPSGKPAKLVNTTVVANKATGVSCSAAVTATGLIAYGNAALDLNPTCGLSTCCTGDPMLTSTYRLMSGSPCIDKLDPAMSVPDDIDGKTRPYNGKSDCGASEWSP